MYEINHQNKKNSENNFSNLSSKNISQFNSSSKRNINNTKVFNIISEDIVKNKTVAKKLKFEDSEIKEESIFIK
jgi:hypothetical protein